MLLNRVHVFANFMLNLNRGTWCSVCPYCTTLLFCLLLFLFLLTFFSSSPLTFFMLVFGLQNSDREKYWKENYNHALKEKEELLEKAAAFEVQIIDLEEEIRCKSEPSDLGSLTLSRLLYWPPDFTLIQVCINYKRNLGRLETGATDLSFLDVIQTLAVTNLYKLTFLKLC